MILHPAVPLRGENVCVQEFVPHRDATTLPPLTLQLLGRVAVGSLLMQPTHQSTWVFLRIGNPKAMDGVY